MAANLEKAQEQILLDKEYMTNVVDSITNGIIVVDREGRITTWNRAMEQMYDLPAPEMIGRVFLEAFPVLYQEGTAQALLDLLAGRTGPFHFREFEHQTLKKGRVIQNFSGYPLRGPDGHLLGAVMVIEDVTATVALERQVQQSERLAVIGQLAAGIAHQIGTPLNVISGSAEYLMAEFKGDPSKVEELQVIVSQADRIARLIRQLLNFARPAKLELGEVNVNDILKGVLRLTEPQISKERIRVKTEFEEVLFPIAGDFNQLEQAFLNIIVNAWQAMPDGGALTIKTRGQFSSPPYPLYPNADFVEIIFADTGCGIAPENLPHIFSPFFSTKELRKGTGLGLAISQRIIQDHQGTIEVESQWNKTKMPHLFLLFLTSPSPQREEGTFLVSPSSTSPSPRFPPTSSPPPRGGRKKGGGDIGGEGRDERAKSHGFCYVAPYSLVLPLAQAYSPTKNPWKSKDYGPLGIRFKALGLKGLAQALH